MRQERPLTTQLTPSSATAAGQSASGQQAVQTQPSPNRLQRYFFNLRRAAQGEFLSGIERCILIGFLAFFCFQVISSLVFHQSQWVTRESQRPTPEWLYAPGDTAAVSKS
jgi:hypothetical protein